MVFGEFFIWAVGVFGKGLWFRRDVFVEDGGVIGNFECFCIFGFHESQELFWDDYSSSFNAFARGKNLYSTIYKYC